MGGVPIGAAAAVLLVLGAGLALWPGYDRMSDRSDSSDPFLMTKPVLPEKAEVQALQPWTPANSTVSTGPMIDGGKPQSQASKNSAAGFWGSQDGVAGSAASSYPADAMPAAPPMAIKPALPAAPAMGPAVVPPGR